MKITSIVSALLLSLLLLGCGRPEPVKTKKAPRIFVEFGQT